MWYRTEWVRVRVTVQISNWYLYSSGRVFVEMSLLCKDVTNDTSRAKR